ncbi:C-C motif chemokine 21-like isoform 2-T2 [Porphyrio hochstetteri]
MALRLLLPLLLLATTFLIVPAQGIDSSATDCCLKHSQRTIPRHMVKSYTIQGPETGCTLRAAVLITKKNKKICASPTNPDILKLMRNLDKKAKSKKGQSPRAGGKPKQQKRQRV